ncbi:MAG: hypothetical protein CMC76_01420 [Flavobacteriaceae bacterium]|nr:hypothetical protein [Flavobacteriaceae bacterium]|tara:strand:- start:18 stop:602 length:585 start_codon:yes stop_codon:yes gene_type:complete
MRALLGLLLIVVIGFTSCEGRRTSNQSLADSVEEFKKTVNFQKDIYIPETYIEREVDTLLSNGFHVKIKSYSDMSNSVLFTKIKDTINYQTHYRNFKFDILVEKDGKIIYNKSFDKKKANKAFGFRSNFEQGSELHNFHELAVLKSVQVDDDPSLTNNVAIDFIYTIPETERRSYHRMTINSKGRSNFIQTAKK